MLTSPADRSGNPIRRISARAAEKTAPARCAAYAALSELLASPHDIDPRAGLLEKVRALSVLGYAGDLDALLREFSALEPDTLKREYSGLFEVGSNGPPCPIREDLQTGQRAGTREDLVRFYNFFNYKLDDKYAWAPDHLSVQLEFMHYLCYLEASAESDAKSFQLAQIDFSERHLVRWVPELAKNVTSTAPGSIYSRVMAAVDEFLAADHAWQGGTISTQSEVAD